MRVLSKPQVKELPRIYRELGVDYDERILPSIIHEMLKQVVARYNASNLLTQREEVYSYVRRSIVERAKMFNIEIEDVSFINMSFGKEFTAAVEAKQVGKTKLKM